MLTVLAVCTRDSVPLRGVQYSAYPMPIRTGGISLTGLSVDETTRVDTQVWVRDVNKSPLPNWVLCD